MTVFRVRFKYGDWETARYEYVRAADRFEARDWARERFTDPKWSFICQRRSTPAEAEVYEV